MIEILVVNNAVYENIEEQIYVFPEAADENTENLQLIKIPNPIIPTDAETLRKAIKDTVLYLAKQRIQKFLFENGYHDLGDLFYYAQQNDEEAQELLHRYQMFDSFIWDFLDTLNDKNYDELLEIARILRTHVNGIDL